MDRLMGTHVLYVRFPDGEIRFGLYHSASDLASPELVNSPGEAWAMQPAGPYPPMDGSGERVEVASMYGAGFWWEATATREHLTSNVAPFQAGVARHDGTPEWLDDYFAHLLADELVEECRALDRAMLYEHNRRLVQHFTEGDE